MKYPPLAAGGLWTDLARFQFDAFWAAGEAFAGLSAFPALSALAQRGNGSQPVITFPGFASPELSLTPLNLFLNQMGFRAESWVLGVNKGPVGDHFYRRMGTALRQQLQTLAEETGQKVSLIGQSLGGLYAREVARDHPDLVDRVITLASPVYASSHSIKSMNNVVAAMLNLLDGSTGRPRPLREPKRDHHRAPPVPLVAVYSRFDGILDWQATRIPDGQLTRTGVPRENIEVVASHGGMTVNPLVLLALCDRLTADPAEWLPFDPDRYFGRAGPALRNILFPAAPGLAAETGRPADHAPSHPAPRSPDKSNFADRPAANTNTPCKIA